MTPSVLAVTLMAMVMCVGDPRRDECVAKGGDYVKIAQRPYYACVEKMRRV